MINTANASANISASAFFSELMKISTGIVWKNQMLANRYEDREDYINTELFTSAAKNNITFESIYQFDYNILIRSGLSEEQALAGMDSKNTIPSQYRDICVRKYIDNVLEKNNNTGRYINYIETNNYYRMLFGLPDMEDTDYLYNTKYDGVSKVIPIHELSIHERYILETNGYLSELLTKYPEKKYLKHLTDKCIDPLIARNIDRFGIMYITGSDFTNLILDFKSVYEDCRINVNRVYYTEAFRKDSELYEGFMAMCILFMTIQLMHQRYLDTDLTRDFYDLDSIKYIYSNYSVPYYSNIPLSYHIKIVKNLNSLLSYKGSNRIFFDLFDLFNYGSIDVYNYYLLKTHKFDADNKPVFVKNIDNTYDYSSMYDIKFAKVDITKNPQIEITNPLNHIDYNIMTGNDPYWVSDPELMDKLYSTKFNYLESKYIGLQVVFDLTKIVYESAYLFKMLLDNKSEIANLAIYVSTVSGYVKLFDIIIYLCALICKKYGYEGNISSRLPVVAKILGFNFQEDLVAIRNDISTNNYLKNDVELLDLLVSIDEMGSITSINQSIDKISKLRSLISRRKINTKSKNEFHAYSHLERTLMISDLIEDVYLKTDGEIASTFEDLLDDSANYLYVRLNSVDLSINNEINIILETLIRTFSSAKYINYSDINNIDATVTQLFKLLYFFKSAKSELVGYNIIYTFSLRGANMLRLIDQMMSSNEVIFKNTNIDSLEDTIKINSSIQKYITDKNLSLFDISTLYLNYKYYQDLEIPLTDQLMPPSEVIFENSNMNSFEDIVKINSFVQKYIVDKNLSLFDIGMIYLYYKYYENLDVSLIDRIKLIIMNYPILKVKENDLYIDNINNYSESYKIGDSDTPFSDTLTLIHETLVP